MKLNNKLNKKLNKKLVSLLLIGAVTLTAIFIASCAEKKTTAGGTTGSGGSITDGGGGPPACAAGSTATDFVSEWNLSLDTGTGADKIKLPLVDASKGGSYNFTVNWGDSTAHTVVDDANITAGTVDGTTITAPTGGAPLIVTHTYDTTDTTTFEVKITGTIKGWQFGSSTSDSDAKKLTKISSFGPLDLGATDGKQFYAAENLEITAADAPTLCNTKDLGYAFYRATRFNVSGDGSLNGWNVSGVKDMEYMFSDATSFNADISGWDVSALTAVSYLFGGATSFDQNLTPWDDHIATCIGGEGVFSGTLIENNTAKRPKKFAPNCTP